MMDATQALKQGPALNQAELVRQVSAALKRGMSVLVIGLPSASEALAEVASKLGGGRTRVLRVRPPYNLTSFMQQLSPGGSEEDGSLLDGAYEALAVLDKSCTRIALLAEDAHLLPKTTLRYIESALRNRPHVTVALAGQPELVNVLDQPELDDLRERLSLHMVLAGEPGAPVGPVAARTRPARRGAWAAGILLALACAGVVGSQVVDVRRLATLPYLSGLPWLGGPATNASPGTARQDAAVLPPAAPPGDAPSGPPGSLAAPSPAMPASEPPAAAPVPAPPGLTAANPSAAPPTAAATAPVVAAAAPPVAAPPAAAPSVAVPSAVAPPVVASPAVAPPAASPAAAGPVMVTVYGGEFRMGSNDDQFERPVHAVVVKPFLISKTAVTVRDWGRCVEAGACHVAVAGQPNEPAVNISWDDANGYAAWLSSVTQQAFRLPTEAEWEFAARAGAGTRYAWGSVMVPGRMSCKGCGEPVSPLAPPKVDAYPANAYGLFGMGGGVAEWVADCWHRRYQGAPNDSSAPWNTPGCTVRVLRGGGWMEDTGAQRTSAREGYDAGVRHPTHGFRVAQSK